MSDFLFCILIGNHRTSVHLRACSNHCQHTTNRNHFTIRLLKTDKIFFPRIFLTIDRNRYCLRIVADRSSTDSQQQVRLMALSDLNTLIQLCKCWVWHNSGDFRHILSILFQNFDHFIIDSILLN